VRLINTISIKGFRSIQNQTIEDLGNLNCFVGKNSSGKSNILRALNLFFNDETEDGKPVDFAVDHHYTPKKKKQIEISLKFDIPSTFKYRKEFKERLEDLGSSFTIKRTWQLDPRREPYSTIEIEDFDDEGAEETARQFLSLITFRYVPNRSVPTQILEKESKGLADSLLFRLKGEDHGKALLSSIEAASQRMLTVASKSMSEIGAPITQPSLATSESVAEMLTMTGFTATGAHGSQVDDTSWGSGHQAFFLFLMLHLIDTSYAKSFGWRQATIWAIEEPESGLHRDLETQLAAQIREWSDDTRSRIQIFQTTHSPIFSMASDSGYWVSLDGPHSTITAMPLHDLTVASEREGVSGWMHPALSFPWNPVVLVEGGIDARVLQHVAHTFREETLRFLTLGDFDNADGKGKDAIIKWLRSNKKYLKNRPASSPLVVVFDWDVSTNELNQAKAAYGENAEFSVLRTNPDYCDDTMGEDIRGIERFYPPKVFHDAMDAGECTIGVNKKSGVISVSKSELNNAKAALVDRLVRTTSKQDLRPLHRVLKDILSAVRSQQDLDL